MQELEVTWGRALSVWWLIAWRTLAGAVVIGLVIGLVVGLVGALAGMPSDRVAPVSTILGALGAIVWGPFVVRMALRKRYSDFRSVLVAPSGRF